MEKALKKQNEGILPFLRKHPIVSTIFLFCLYVLVFSILERAEPTSVFLIDLKIDHLIPFSKYSVFLYCTWHLEIAAILLSYIYCKDIEGYWETAGKLLTAMFSVLLLCAIFPNMIDLRPASVEGTDVFARMTRMVYSMDNCRNVFPSGHAAGAVIMALGWSRLAGKTWQKVFAWAMNIGIIMSTFFLKQHSVVDAAAGIILAFIIELLANRIISRYRLKQPAAGIRKHRAKSSLKF